MDSAYIERVNSCIKPVSMSFSEEFASDKEKRCGYPLLSINDVALYVTMSVALTAVI